MKVRFEQLFYGRGVRGYGVLAASPGGRRFAARADALCGGVGTPFGDCPDEPFLLSVPDGDCVLMACGRRGAPDSMGRGTLFFHVLAARRADLDAAGADAFSLFAQGAFAERMPDGELESLSLEVVPPPRMAAAGTAELPAVVRAERPATDAVRVLAGGRANGLSWATFAFQPMEGFDIQVLPRGVPVPLLDAAPAREAPRRRSRAGTEELPAPRATEKPSSTPLKLSLFANFLLAVVCAGLWAARPPSGAAPKAGAGGTPPLSEGQNALIEREAVERFRAELAAAIPEEERIEDFDGETPAMLRENPFVQRAKPYVELVARRILAAEPRKETEP